MINLQKGGKIDLTKEVPGLKRIKVQLNWKPQTRVGEEFDIDSSVGVIGGNLLDEDYVYFKNLKHPSGAVVHSGDDRTGGQGEIIDVDFTKMPADKEKLVFIINIHDALARRQNFGQINDSIATVIDADTNRPIASFDLGEDFSSEITVVACEIYRHNGEWRFKADGSGYKNGLAELLKDYGFDA